MKRLLLLATAAALAACSPAPPAPAASASPSAAPAALPLLEPAPARLGDLMKSRTWRTEDGKLLADWFDAEAKRLMKPMTRSQTVDQFQTAGWECMYGEGSEDYPNPLQVCTLSFGTPECQLDWEISTEAENSGATKDVSTTFTRDCIGVDRDWPEKKTGPMDDNLAKPALPTPSPAPPH
jgi:hypothetical protein